MAIAALMLGHHLFTAKKLCLNCGSFHALRALDKRKLHLSSLKETNEPKTKQVQAESCNWKSVIGLEIHAQIKSDSKLFSGAGTEYLARTNNAVSYFDAALPGTLPVLNKRCVEAGVKTALALGCNINRKSLFDRKHYFYADLPTGFQITQQRKPLAVGGDVDFVRHCTKTNAMDWKTVRLVQLQLEIDSGKSIHDKDDKLSLIDLNRAGTGLMEIVTAPDFNTADEAVGFVRDLRALLVHIDTCDGKMNEGSLRIDANISVHHSGDPLGTRTEVKNLNSVNNMRKAINYEINRQIQILNSGGTVINETLNYNPEKEQTVAMRDKEKMLDYRFMPEPNLPPLVLYDTRDSVPVNSQGESPLNTVVIEEVAATMTELPGTKQRRLESQYGLQLGRAIILVRTGMTELFETLVNQHECDPRVSCQVVSGNFVNFLADNKLDWQNCPVKIEELAEIVTLMKDKALSKESLDTLLQEKLASPASSLQALITNHNLQLVTDFDLITEVIDEILGRYPKMIKNYQTRGKVNLAKVVYKWAMKKLEDRADSRTVEAMVRKRMTEWKL